MLVYCFLSELISTPIFLIGYYENLFKDSIVLCQVSTLHYLTINIGMVTSLAYASVERHFLIFQKNGILTWARQIFPNTCLLIYSYIIAALFTLLPTCTYVPCIPCQATTVFYMIPWLTLSFFLPQCVMLVSTIYLLYRLRQQRSIVNRRVEWLVSRKIVVQMSLYVLWSCLYYCPVTFYNFIVLFDTSRYSPQLKSAMTIINTVGVQSYSILTFISMWLFTKRTKEQRKTQQRMKLNNLSSIILTMPKTNQRSSKWLRVLMLVPIFFVLKLYLIFFDHLCKFFSLCTCLLKVSLNSSRLNNDRI